MILSHLELYNFRKFKSVDGKPGLSVSFHQGLNALIGENDSGKTAIIDAIKLVLLTQSNEFIRATDEDFYTTPDGNVENDLRINLVLDDFSEQEAKNFIEYLSFRKKDDGTAEYFMQLHYHAWREKNRIFNELRAGDPIDGVVMESRARELLKTVYLKPLRDAEHEMRAGRNSRISQILINHPVFSDKEENELVEILCDSNSSIKKYFTEKKGKEILDSVRKSLGEFSNWGSSSEAQLVTSEIKLKAILESLSLVAPEFHPGLGELNLLFIAAELLLLNHDDNGGLRLAIIEELEAHLHPQAQLRLIEYLQREYRKAGVQIIISTHSPVLASKINLKNLVLVKNDTGYDLAPGNTKLLRGDYLFLQRFLDATKANMFFAKGIIMVEGDAENLVIPVIADIIGYPLEKHGISIVNVGSTAFLRYSRIFARADDTTIGVPVSIITDCDIKPKEADDGTFDARDADTATAIEEKKKKYNIGDIQAYISPRWTFEYCIALSCLSDKFHRAIHCAKKIKNSDQYTLTKKKMEEIAEAITEENTAWTDAHLPIDQIAFKMYKTMLDEDDKSALKAITAQCLSAILQLAYTKTPGDFTEEDDMFDLNMLQWEVDEENKQKLKEEIEQDENLKYLVDAIKHAAGANKE